MVAAVATLDPEIAENTAQAAMMQEAARPAAHPDIERAIELLGQAGPQQDLAHQQKEWHGDQHEAR
jgi:hypothetical protein